MLDRQASKHQEQPVAMGIASTGELIEVLASDDGKTWTIIMTAPKSITCIMAAGTAWRGSRAHKVGGPGA